MRIFFLGLVIFIFHFALLLKAETWSCAYKFNNEARAFIITREGGNFRTGNNSIYDIVFENKKNINLHNTFSPMYPDYFAILLDKEKNMFAMVALEIGDHSSIIEGDCKILQ